MITISVELEAGSNKLIAALEELGPAIEYESERALDQSAAAILSRLRASYLAESDPEGVKWKPSRAGLRRKSRGGTGTMFDTGRLFRSIQLYVDSDKERRISTDVFYGPYLQNSLKVPRPFLTLTEGHIDLTRKVFQNRMKELFREQGF